MHAQHALPLGDLPHFAQSAGAAISTPNPGFAQANSQAPRFVRSVVEQEGLGRFVYLTGISGRRYVFSAIKSEQMRLYENAVFACGDADGVAVDLCASCRSRADGCMNGKAVYVHLLSDDEGGSTSVMADLFNTAQ